MMSLKTFVTLTTTLLLASPAASATWMAFGTHEPDTTHDSEDFMFFDAPAEAGVNAVYFNGWTSINGGANPNAGLAGTRNEVATSEIYTAILGVWLDCNGDGYVGMAETAVREYDSKLLLDTSVCPPATGTANTWSGDHNYNGWVSEFVPIGGSGGDPADDTGDRRIHRDGGARVWGDLSLPNADATGGGGTCPVFAPHGTHQTTGGIITHYDCFSGLIDRYNQVLRDGFRVQGEKVAPGADEGNLLGLHFADNNNAKQAGHPLHQPTLGTENSTQSAVYYADCDAEPIVRVNSTETMDGTDVEETAGREVGTLNGIEFTQQPLNPRQGSSSNPTVAGTINATSEEGLENCDYQDDNGRDTYGNLEADTQVSNPADKRRAGLNFAFGDSTRGSGNPAFAVLHGGTAGMDNNGGIRNFAGTWAGNSNLLKTTQPYVRTNVGQGSVIVAPAYIVTYYAHVGENITAGGFALPGGAGVYGGTQCGSETSGILGGWNCDKNLWYKNPNDGSQIAGTNTFALPGDPYELRDIDCHDGGNNFGIPTGAPSFGNSPCPS